MYLMLTKKKLAVLLCSVVLLFVFTAQFFSVKANDIDVSTNAKRVQYINTLGITLQSDNFAQKTVVIPQEFSDVYKKYNALQIEAGFNLLNYCGKEVSVYTYNKDDQTVVNLIVYKGRLVGGDVASLNINGEMTALKGKNNDERTF